MLSKFLIQPPEPIFHHIDPRLRVGIVSAHALFPLLGRRCVQAKYIDHLNMQNFSIIMVIDCPYSIRTHNQPAFSASSAIQPISGKIALAPTAAPAMHGVVLDPILVFDQ